MAIVIEANKDTTRKQLDEALKKIKRSHHIRLDKYFGKIKFTMDGLDYQKIIRNEWQ